MDDDIQLPPLPPVFEWVSMAPTAKTIKEYARAAIRYDRERRAKVAAKPVVHSTTLRLCPDGYAWRGTDVEAAAPGYGVLVDLRWTADGRAWIESEQNRKLARRLRFLSLRDAADALYWEPQ